MSELQNLSKQIDFFKSNNDRKNLISFKGPLGINNKSI